MSLFKTVLYNHFHTILKPQKPLYGSQIIKSYFSHKCRAFSSLFYSTTTSSPQIEDRIEPEEDNEKLEKKKPLDVMFTEAVGLRLCENEETSEGATDGENNELKSSLRELETEVRRLKATSSAKESVKITKSNKGTGKTLYATFTNQTAHNKGRVQRTLDEPQVYKELSPDMEVFVNHLCSEGYFNDANFLLGSKLEFGCFENHYGQNYIKFAAEKFSKDNQEIAKWLSGSDLKKVALFGCPSLSRKNVFAAKRLRKFFEIPENTVCSKCVLKQSCNFANQSVWKGDVNNLNLAVIMRVIMLYALELVPSELEVPSEIKGSVSRLLKQVLKLSQKQS